MRFLQSGVQAWLLASWTARWLLLTTVMTLVPGSTKAFESKPDQVDPKLNGTWKMVSMEHHDETTTFDEKAIRLVIDGTKVNYAKEKIASIVADGSVSPAILDWKSLPEGKEYEGIYVIEGDKLRICLNSRTEGVKERPGLFSTKDQASWRLLTFQKEASTPENETEGLTGYVGLALRFEEDRKCIEVQSTFDGSPAKKAGLEKGDVVLSIADKQASELLPTIEIVRKSKPATKLDFKIRRGDKVMDIQVLVGAMPFPFIAGLE